MDFFLRERRLGVPKNLKFGRLVAVLILVGSLNGRELKAQTTVYTWTDEKGVVHFSNITVSKKEPGPPLTPVPLPYSPSSSSQPQTSPDIPLVILNNNPSQKFVRVTLRGERSSRETLMLVDTGAQMTVVDEALAREVGLEYVREIRLIGITGSAPGWIGRLSSLRLGKEEIENLEVLVGPLPGRLLLGMDVLERLRLAVGPQSLKKAR